MIMCNHNSGVPIKDQVSAFMWHQPTEQSADIVVIGLGIQRQHLQVVQEGSILSRKPIAQAFDRVFQLLLGYEIRICQTFQRQAPTKQIHENICKGLKVVSPSKFAACMTVIQCEQQCFCQSTLHSSWRIVHISMSYISNHHWRVLML